MNKEEVIQTCIELADFFLAKMETAKTFEQQNEYLNISHNFLERASNIQRTIQC